MVKLSRSIFSDEACSKLVGLLVYLRGLVFTKFAVNVRLVYL